MELQIKEYSKNLDTEARRLVFAYNQIYTGFYGDKRILVLPNVSEITNYSYVPELDYSKLKPFFDRKSDEYFVGEEDKKVIKTMKEIMNEHDLEVTEKSFNEKELKSIVKTLEKKIPKIFSNPPEKLALTVFETDYGTGSSFGRFKKGRDGWTEMRIFIRSDKDIKQVIPLTLMSIISDNKYAKIKYAKSWQTEWEINQSILDYFMEYTVFSEIYPNHVSFLQTLEEQLESGAYVLESMKYYARLGYPIDSVLSMKGKTIYYADIDLNTILTPTERRMVRHFIKNRGKVCTFEELSKVIWKEEATEKFSLWAIAKVIQKLREKLDDLGAPHNLIQTKRKEGYILFD